LIATHSDDLSFQVWIDEVRIPEECLEYRDFLDNQTSVVIPAAIAAFDNSAIEDVLYLVREGDEGVSKVDWSNTFYNDIFIPLLVDESLVVTEGEYVVEEAYKTYCGDTPGQPVSAKDYAGDEASIRDYNLKLTQSLYVEAETTEACSARQSKYTAEGTAAADESEAVQLMVNDLVS
jgi:hypothetical protein